MNALDFNPASNAASFGPSSSAGALGRSAGFTSFDHAALGDLASPTSATERRFEDVLTRVEERNAAAQGPRGSREPVITSINPLNAGAAELPAAERWSLRGAMESARSQPPPGVSDDTWSEARQQAGELVALSLVQPILAEMRETNQAWGPFAPGAWEKRLGPILDAAVAKDVVSSSSWGLIDQLASRFLGSPTIENHRTAADR